MYADLRGLSVCNLIYAYNWGVVNFNSGQTTFIINPIPVTAVNHIRIISSGLYWLITTANNPYYDGGCIFYYNSFLNHIHGMGVVRGYLLQIQALEARNTFGVSLYLNANVNMSLNLYRLTTLTIDPPINQNYILYNQTTGNTSYRKSGDQNQIDL